MNRKPKVAFQDWTKNKLILQQKVYSVLADIIKDPAHVAKMFDQNALINYWEPAFTHSSVSEDNNYELLEAYGDKTMDYCLTLYFRKAFGDEKLDPETLSFIKREFVSGPFQAALARDLGLDQYIYYNHEIELTKAIEEDVLEAFFGALNSLADDVIGFGTGFIYSFNLFTKLYNNANIDLTKVKKDNKTLLKELFEAKYNEKNVPYTTTQSKNLQFGNLQSEVTRLDGSSLGVGYGNSKDEAELNASTIALQSLKNLGITPESAKKEKRERAIIMIPEYNKEYKRAEAGLAILNAQGRARGQAEIVTFLVKQKKTDMLNTRGPLFHYSLEVGFSQLDGSVAWRSFLTETGNDPTRTKIELVRKFADSLGVPK